MLTDSTQKSGDSGLVGSVPTELAHRLDIQAMELMKKLSPKSNEEPTLEDDAIADKIRFRPTLFLKQIHIEGKELPTEKFNRDKRQKIGGKSLSISMNMEGNEVGRYFPFNGKWIGFSGSAWEEFTSLCRRLYAVETVGRKLSLSTLTDAALQWFQMEHYQQMNAIANEHNLSRADLPRSFTGEIIASCELEVESFEIYVPLGKVVIEAPFSVGAVHFKSLNMTDLRSWERDWVAKWQYRAHPQAERGVSFFAELIATQKPPIPVAYISLQAEAIRAAERALDEVDRATAILRFFSPANFYPTRISRCSVEGVVNAARRRHLLSRAETLIFAGETADDPPNRPLERFDLEALAEMRPNGLEILDPLLLLDQSERSSWQRQIIKALEIYGRASLSRDVRDKLLFNVVALELLLVREQEGSLRKNVSERLAYFLGQSINERHDIIDIYTEAYAIRSNAVHNGDTPADYGLLVEFLQMAWHALKRIIQDSQLY